MGGWDKPGHDGDCSVRVAASRSSAQSAASRTTSASSSSRARAASAKRRIARVADRVEDVADEAVAADALDRALGEEGAEGRVVEGGEVGERRARAGLARVQRRLAAGLGELVPGADGQAVVAAVDAVAQRGAVALGIGPACSMVR